MSTEILRRLVERPLYFYERVGVAIPTIPFAAARLATTVVFAHGSENWRNIRKRDLGSILTARLMITNSEYTFRRMTRAVKRFRGVACPLGLSPVFALNEQAVESGREEIELRDCEGVTRRLGNRVLLLVARMDPVERMKGHFPLLKVFPEVLRRFPGTQLVFAGPGEDRPLVEQVAREQGVAASVFLPGHVPAETLVALYRHCYAFVMPSRQEGFGMAYLEAMNQARACLGCFEDGAEDVIVHGETGLLIRNPDDPTELSEALFGLLSDPDRVRRWGIAALDRLHGHFTGERFRQRFKAILAPVLREHLEGRIASADPGRTPASAGGT
jgi:glycosyltransferase involved in cell wall biosynthesis